MLKYGPFVTAVVLASIYIYGRAGNHTAGNQRMMITDTIIQPNGDVHVTAKTMSGQVVYFTAENLPAAPMVNNTICVEVTRGHFAFSAEYKIRSMLQCPAEFRNNTRFVSTRSQNTTRPVVKKAMGLADGEFNTDLTVK